VHPEQLRRSLVQLKISITSNRERSRNPLRICGM
jgi:hypothetical protein